MTPFFGSVLISTGDAARATGYSSDYLLRLVGSGIVPGRKFGDTWFVSRFALEQHLESKRPLAYFAFAEAQSAEISDHMRSAQPAWLNGVAKTPLHEQLFALSIAAVVLLMGATLARTAYLPNLGAQVVSMLQTTSQEVRVALQNSATAHAPHLTLPAPARGSAYAAAAVEATQAMQRELGTGVAGTPVSTIPAQLHEAANRSAQRYEARGVRLLAALVAALPVVASHFDSMQHAEASVGASYLSMGAAVYSVAYAIPGQYLTAVHWAGAQLFSLAVQTRDVATVFPGELEHSLALVGRDVQILTQSAIRLDVRLAYGIATVTPSAARDMVLAVGAVGTSALQLSGDAPYVARDAFLSVASTAAYAGPALAQQGLALEYGGARLFTNAVQSALVRYEGGIQQSAVAIDASVGAVFSATQQAVGDVRVAIAAFANTSRVSVERGAAASAAAIQAFSSAVPGRP